MSSWLKGFLDVREGERAGTAAMFVYILLVIAVLVIVKSVRQALFLQSFGAASLPYVYLLIAFVAGGVAALYQRFSRNVAVGRLIVGTMLVLVANLVVFRWLVSYEWGALAYVLYVWVGVYGILATAQFWMLANYVYDPRQAKRLFAYLGVGATLGGIVGGYVTQYGAGLVGTENLLLIGAALLGGCAALGVYLAASQKKAIVEAARAKRFKSSSVEQTAGGFRLIWQSRYLKLVMVIITLSIIIATVVDNQFSFVVEEHIPTKDGKTAFFGQFFTWLGWIAFLTQFFLTGRLLRRFGVGLTMAILPWAMFLSSGAFVLFPMMATGVAIKLADGTFRYTTHKGSLELLYLPIPIAVKNKTKAFIDMFTDRFSKGIAALLVLLMTSALGFHYGALSWVLMGLSLVWVGVTILARREYVAAFRDSLLRRRIDEDALIISRTDAATVGALAESLDRAQGASLSRALDLVTGVRSSLLIAPLIRIAHASDSAVACRALDLLAEQEGDIPVDQLRDLLDSDEVEVVGRVLRLSCRDAGDVSPLKLGLYFADERPQVRLGAIMCSLVWGGAAGDMIDPEALEQFLLDSATPQQAGQMERMLAKLLRVLPVADGTGERYILRFLKSDDPALRGEAIAAAGRLKPRSLVEPLIAVCADRRVRHRVRDALAAYGEAALGTLEDYLRDEATDRRVRQYIPRILERIPVQRSVDSLAAMLEDPDERVRFSALRALGRLRASHSELDYANERVERRLGEEIRKAYRYQGWLLASADGERSLLLRKTLREKSHKTQDRVFRLLAMKHPPAEVYAASRGLLSPNARIRANAVEYLDNLLVAPQKRWVLGLVEDRPSRDAVSRALREFGETLDDRREALTRQASGDDDWLAACALYSIWEEHERSLYHLITRDVALLPAGRFALTRETMQALRGRVAAE